LQAGNFRQSNFQTELQGLLDEDLDGAQARNGLTILSFSVEEALAKTSR
jgi:hypothetical protein